MSNLLLSYERYVHNVCASERQGRMLMIKEMTSARGFDALKWENKDRVRIRLELEKVES